MGSAAAPFLGESWFFAVVISVHAAIGRYLLAFEPAPEVFLVTTKFTAEFGCDCAKVLPALRATGSPALGAVDCAGARRRVYSRSLLV